VSLGAQIRRLQMFFEHHKLNINVVKHKQRIMSLVQYFFEKIVLGWEF
jgi:hypothetical protein